MYVYDHTVIRHLTPHDSSLAATVTVLKMTYLMAVWTEYYILYQIVSIIYFAPKFKFFFYGLYLNIGISIYILA
jgi:hypothetical protein